MSEKKGLPKQLDFASDRDARFDKLEADLADEAKAQDAAQQEGANSASNDPPSDSPLFEELGEATDDDAVDSLFDEEEGEGDDDGAKEGKGDDKEPRVPKKRLDKVIGQRNDERKQSAKLREENAELRGEVAALKVQTKLAQVFQEKYGKFDDPEKQALWDSNFMEAMEELAKKNPEVATTARLVTEHLGGTVSKPEPKPDAQQAEPKPDPAVVKIIERDARRTIADSLESLNVKPSFAKLVTKHILDATEDLTELDSAAVITSAREFIRENEFEPADVLKQASADPKPEGDKKKAPAKPPTGSDRQAATDTPSKSKGGEPQGDKAPDKPATRDEWEANRNERLAALGTDLGLDD